MGVMRGSEPRPQRGAEDAWRVFGECISGGLCARCWRWPCRRFRRTRRPGSRISPILKACGRTSWSAMASWSVSTAPATPSTTFPSPSNRCRRCSSAWASTSAAPPSAPATSPPSWSPAICRAFGTQGTRMDVTVSSLGDAKNLQGGTLLVTPLLGADGNVYAVAQGSVAIGGFQAEGEAAKHHPRRADGRPHRQRRHHRTRDRIRAQPPAQCAAGAAQCRFHHRQAHRRRGQRLPRRQDAPNRSTPRRCSFRSRPNSRATLSPS